MRALLFVVMMSLCASVSATEPETQTQEVQSQAIKSIATSIRHNWEAEYNNEFFSIHLENLAHLYASTKDTAGDLALRAMEEFISQHIGSELDQLTSTTIEKIKQYAEASLEPYTSTYYDEWNRYSKDTKLNEITGVIRVLFNSSANK